MAKTVDIVYVTDTFGNINVYDLRIGTSLMHYKSSAIPANCLSVLQDHVIAAEKGPLIYVWPLNSQEKSSTIRMVCPGVVGTCSASPDELYFAVSTAEKLLIWQLSSGKLLNTVSSHYQSITVIRWSQDGSDIVTGGEDGLVCVWKLSHLISTNYMYSEIKSGNVGSSQIEPRFTFSHHSVRITDLYIGHGGLRARLFTASADKTCKIYDLASGSQLLSVVFDTRPMTIIPTVPEIRVFVGMFDGTIKSFSLLEPPRSLEYHYETSETNIVFTGHTKAVTCLAFSVDDSILISGSADETIKFWHVNSKQLIRTIRMKGVVSNLCVRLSSESLQSYELKPTTVIKSFQKRYDDNQDANTLEVVCPVDNYNRKISVNGNETDDNAMLRQKIEELQRINKELYNYAKNQILESKDESNIIESRKEKIHVNIIAPQKNVKSKKIKLSKKRKNKT